MSGVITTSYMSAEPNAQHERGVAQHAYDGSQENPTPLADAVDEHASACSRANRPEPLHPYDGADGGGGRAELIFGIDWEHDRNERHCSDSGESCHIDRHDQVAQVAQGRRLVARWHRP